MIYGIFALVLAAVLIALFYGDSRTAHHVLQDLGEEAPEEENQSGVSNAKKQQQKTKVLLWVAFTVVAMVVAKTFLQVSPVTFVVGAMTFSCLMYLVARYKLSSGDAAEVKNIEYHLPILMEQLVMAVQSGYDVFSALRVVLEAENATEESQRSPLSKLLVKTKLLIESGVTVEDALKEVSHSVPSPALRHAFVHLAIAHKEGGELVKPLRELSDATQLYYQETIEEEIAKLPVKATLPLVITFAGLLLTFLTSPLIQMMGMTAKSSGVLQ